jgi:hypothetical protein
MRVYFKKEDAKDYAARLYYSGKTERDFYELKKNQDWTHLRISRAIILEARGNLRVEKNDEVINYSGWQFYYIDPAGEGEVICVGEKGSDYAFRLINMYLRGKISYLDFLSEANREERILSALKASFPDTREQLLKAALCYFERQRGYKEPDGDWKAARGFSPWHPSPKERNVCCEAIRPPSWSFPDSLYKHCKTVIHVSNLFGVGEQELRETIAQIKKDVFGPVSLYLLGVEKKETRDHDPKRDTVKRKNDNDGVENLLKEMGANALKWMEEIKAGKDIYELPPDLLK